MKQKATSHFNISSPLSLIGYEECHPMLWDALSAEHAQGVHPEPLRHGERQSGFHQLHPFADCVGWKKLDFHHKFWKGEIVCQFLLSLFWLWLEM